VRLPVRSEEVTLSKQTVVYERVLVGRRGIQEVAHVEAELRREELRATASGDAKIATRDSRANKHVGTGGS
jgi:uncharacterized protein (TIGR02271 family)